MQIFAFLKLTRRTLPGNAPTHRRTKCACAKSACARHALNTCWRAHSETKTKECMRTTRIKHVLKSAFGKIRVGREEKVQPWRWEGGHGIICLGGYAPLEPNIMALSHDGRVQAQAQEALVRQWLLLLICRAARTFLRVASQIVVLVNMFLREPFHSQVQKVHSPNNLTSLLQNSKSTFSHLISDGVRMGSMIISHLSKLWKAI